MGTWGTLYVRLIMTTYSAVSVLVPLGGPPTREEME